MSEYQYTTVPGKLEGLLDKVRDTGIPDVANTKWLLTIGYKSSNDRGLVRILSFIGFIDDSGTPTDLWKKYRGKNHKQVLAEGIQLGYRELFNIYPDAYNRSNDELENFFSTRSSAGKQVISKTVSTFKTLCDLADFKSIPTKIEQITSSKKSDVPKTVVEPMPAPPNSKASQPSPSLHIDIQIHISSDASPEQIDQIFASMAKHLYQSRD